MNTSLIWLSLQKPSILSTTHFRYQQNVISLQLFSPFRTFCEHTKKHPPPSLTYNNVHIFRAFIIQILPQNFFLSYLVQTKLNSFLKYFMKNSTIRCFERYVSSDLERAHTSKHCFIENQLLSKLCLSGTTFFQAVQQQMVSLSACEP